MIPTSIILGIEAIEASTGVKLNLSGETQQEILDASRSAAFFTLDRAYSIQNIIEYGSLFCNSGSLESALKRDNVVPFDRADIREAVEKAFDNIPSQVRFSQPVAGTLHHFDLYCFPELGATNSSIGCFIADRCRDEETARSLQRKIDRLNIINQAVRAFAETTNLNEVLRIILLAVTSGPGLSFNRGFIFLSDETRTYLHGCLATGPSSPAEAGEIWKSLSEKPLSLAEILRFYRSGESPFDTYINQLVTSLKVPLTEGYSYFKKAYDERRALTIDSDLNLNEDEIELKRKLGAQNLAVVPLVSRDAWLGIIIADNLITNKPISPSDLQLLEIFAKYASDAIDNTQLYGRLQRKIAKLKDANEEIIRTRENLIRLEKLTGISKMALEVAHEIRNPLTVIGGHANARLRKIEDDPKNEEIYRIISRQTARIESTLDRFSSIISLSEKQDKELKIGDLIIETVKTLASIGSEVIPPLEIDQDIGDERIYIDRDLFHKAMMIILREASITAGGLSNLHLEVKRLHNRAFVLIGGDESNDRFATGFFDALRSDKAKHKSQDISVALEILRHYGGDMGIGFPDHTNRWLSVEFPIIKEGE